MVIGSTATRPWGGLEKHVIELCNGLAGRCQVVAALDPAFREGLGPEIGLEGIDAGRGRHSPALLLSLRGVFRRHRPDVIHAQGNKAAALVRQAARFLPARRVATIHNQKRGTRMFRGFDRVIAVSKGVAACVSDYDPVVIYNGIAPLSREPRAGVVDDLLGGSRTRPVAVSVGRLVSAKGIDVLIDAWADVEADLVDVGDGPERGRLLARIEQRDLGGRVHLIGHRDDVPDLLSGADLMVISSRREGFSYVFAEGLRARLPVVSTDVPVANELLPEDCIAPPGEVAGLRDVIGRALADLPALRQRFEPVWTFAEKNLTLEAMVARTAALYDAVVAGRSGT
jgi:glycosyltransferase involved in cell wall biosynthesis